MTVNFLFWNIGGQTSSFEKDLADVATNNEIDVIILAEGGKIIGATLLKNGYAEVELQLENKTAKWVRVFSKKTDEYKVTHKTQLTEIEEDEEDEEGTDDSNFDFETVKTKVVNRVQLFELNSKEKKTLFACIHFPSKLFHDEHSHSAIAPKYTEKIHSLAKIDDRLFIVGDFNMNPFDIPLVDPLGFYALNNRDLIDELQSKHPRTKQRYYYNPCWSLLGDFVASKSSTTRRLGGTFRFQEQRSRKLHWYLVDQMIMNKALIEDFHSNSLRVIEQKNLVLQLFEKKIKKQPKLDHLPITFSFNI